MCGEDIRPRCSQGHVSGAGEQFCQLCGELLVLAEPPADIPVLDYSSGSFSEFIARTEALPPSAPSAPGSFGRQPGTAGSFGRQPAAPRSFVRGPSPAEVFTPGAELGRSPGGAAGAAFPTGPATRGASGMTTEASPAPSQPAVPSGAASPPRRARRLLLELAAVIILVAGGTVLALALHRHFAANLTTGRASYSPAASSRPSPAVSSASPPAAQGYAAPPTAWSSTAPVPASMLDGAALTGISCPLPSVCYAIDSGGKVLASTRPSPWRVAAKDGAGALTAISCATAQSCLALDLSGNAMVLNGNRWSSPVFVDARKGTFTAVSCPSPSFCMTTDSGGNAFIYTPKGWHPFTVDTTGRALTSVSCVSADFCLAVGATGNSYTYDGTSWSGPSRVGDGHRLAGVSCATQVFCMAVGDSGHAGVYTSGHWKTATVRIAAVAVACPASGFCLATGKAGSAVLYRSGSWAQAHAIDGSATLGMLACPSVTGCTAADSRGNVMSYVPPTPRG